MQPLEEVWLRTSPKGHVHILDLVDSNLSDVQIVQAQADFNKSCS